MAIGYSSEEHDISQAMDGTDSHALKSFVDTSRLQDLMKREERAQDAVLPILEHRRNEEITTVSARGDLIVFPLGPAAVVAFFLVVIGIASTTAALWIAGLIVGLLAWASAPVLAFHRGLASWSAQSAVASLRETMAITNITSDDVTDESRRLRREIARSNPGLTKELILKRTAEIHLPTKFGPNQGNDSIGMSKGENTGPRKAINVNGSHASMSSWIVPDELTIWKEAVDNALGGTDIE